MSEPIPNRLFSFTGVPLQPDFIADVERSDMLNQEGRAEFRIATADSAYVPDYYDGRPVFILCEDPRLAPWVGVFDTPQDNGDFQVMQTAYTVDHVWSWRNGGKSIAISGTPGGLFRQMIRWANSQGPTIIKEGQIDDSGAVVSDAINLTDMQSEISRLQQEYGFDITYTPVIASTGNLVILANWQRRAGAVIDFTLDESYNIEALGNNLSIQGKIINQLTGFGDGATWASRAVYTAQDDVSISKYGLRQGVMNFSGVTDLATVTAKTIAALSLSKNPTNIYRFNIPIMDLGSQPTGFVDPIPYMKIGNTLNAELWSIHGGIKTQVRIMGVLPHPSQGKTEITVNEVFS